jgi:putative N-acetyltransferase (TIGR04045 family)
VSRTSSPSASNAVVCRPAAAPDELAAHLAIRRQVFVQAQGLFEGDDRDARDDDPATIHVVGLVEGEISGAVRLYPLDAGGLWQGDRLAVVPQARALQLGAELVRRAVELGGAAGGHRMLALVQVQNVRFFERLGWRRDGAPALHHGIEHQPMTIALAGALSSPAAA